MRFLGAFGGQGFVVVFKRRFRIQPDVELIAPAKIKPRAAHGIVANRSTRMTFCKVRRVGCQFIGHHAHFHVVAAGKP